MATRTVYNVNGYTVEVFEYNGKYAYDIKAPSGMAMGGGNHDWDFVLGRIFELCIEPRGVTEEIDDPKAWKRGTE